MVPGVPSGDHGNWGSDMTYNYKRRWGFLEWVGPRILLLESVDYFGITEYFSGWNKEESLWAIIKTSVKLQWWAYLVGSVVNFHCIQMSLNDHEHAILFLAMIKSTCHVHHVFDWRILCLLCRILWLRHLVLPYYGIYYRYMYGLLQRVSDFQAF